MGQPVIKVIGEGGAHSHKLETPERTVNDGAHKHLFFVKDRLIMTELDGSHWHPVSPKSNEVGAEAEPLHKHKVSIRAEGGVLEFQTSDGTPHPHELQTENTTLSGLHTHTVDINGEKFLSLLPGDLIEEIESSAKRSKQFKSFCIKKHLKGPLEMDFSLLQRLNKREFSNILSKSVARSILKSLSRLNDGLRIQSLILSKDRFTDIGEARRFVLDHQMNVRSSEDAEGIFRFQVLSNDQFQEGSLQRVRITEGVEAVVGFLTEQIVSEQAAKPEESLTENAVQTEQEMQSQTTTIDAAQDDLSTNNIKSFSERLKALQSYYQEPKEEDKIHLKFDFFEKNEEQRLVKAPALIPDQYDLQDEILGKRLVRKVAHDFLLKLNFQNDEEFLKNLGLSSRADRGFMHSDFARKLAVVESYVTENDMTENGRFIKKGTWIVVMKIFDDETWGLIKAGKITGFSIGGHGRLIDDKRSKMFEPDFIEWRAA